ncbi:MAG: hypothetical protein SVG88_00590 [Halobacteriales archaeon]|nr:hypothetical protein [Halobacteriales archaeon]
MTTAPDDPVAAELRSRGIADVNSVLVLAPAFAGKRRAACSTLLTADSDRPVSVLAVTYRQPDKWLAVWREIDGTPPETTIIRVGEQDFGDTSVGSDSTGDVTIKHSSPDLTDLGIRLTQYLEANAGDGEIHLCFDSINHMLQYAEIKRVFQFLHTFIGRLNRADVHAHFHIDPSAQDQRSVNLVKELFDAIVEIDEDGEITVRAR